jgi:flagellar basal body-associated protein FliL
MNKIILLTLIFCFVVLAGATYMMFFTSNNQIHEVRAVNNSQERALCPFYCIDNGFAGGYYTNWINKCVCRRKE